MAEYIDREEAIQRIRRAASIVGFENPSVAIESVISVIDRVPAADVLEIVSCNDCVLHGNCMTEDTFKIVRIENPYCCAGKKKEGSENG